jgi:BioD-like phosphotransacetylase family protein
VTTSPYGTLQHEREDALVPALKPKSSDMSMFTKACPVDTRRGSADAAGMHLNHALFNTSQVLIAGVNHGGWLQECSEVVPEA